MLIPSYAAHCTLAHRVCLAGGFYIGVQRTVEPAAAVTACRSAWQAPSLFGLTRRRRWLNRHGSRHLATHELVRGHAMASAPCRGDSLHVGTVGATAAGANSPRSPSWRDGRNRAATRHGIPAVSVRRTSIAAVSFSFSFCEELGHGSDTGAPLVTRPHDRCSDTVPLPSSQSQRPRELFNRCCGRKAQGPGSFSGTGKPRPREGLVAALCCRHDPRDKQSIAYYWITVRCVRSCAHPNSLLFVFLLSTSFLVLVACIASQCRRTDRELHPDGVPCMPVLCHTGKPR
jgi:hypothetical protein